jgi:hypothetical protein
MAEPQHDPGILGWALGAVAAAVSAAFTWIWNRMQAIENRLDARMNAAEADEKNHASNSDVRDLWAAITQDRQDAARFREATLVRLGEMPTKTDLREMEARLSTSINSHLNR